MKKITNTAKKSLFIAVFVYFFHFLFFIVREIKAI